MRLPDHITIYCDIDCSDDEHPIKGGKDEKNGTFKHLAGWNRCS